MLLGSSISSGAFIAFETNFPIHEEICCVAVNKPTIDAAIVRGPIVALDQAGTVCSF